MDNEKTPFSHFRANPNLIGKLLAKIEKNEEAEKTSRISENLDKPYLPNTSDKPVEKVGKIRI